MKMPVFAILLVSLCASVAQARDTVHYFPVKDAIEQGQAKGDLGKDVRFYFSGQSHPAVAATLAKGVVTNKKTNAANKSDQEACNHVMLSALIQLQERARKEGGNAVINIESYYKKNPYKSKDQFECHAGFLMSGVALRGDVVKLQR